MSARRATSKRTESKKATGRADVPSGEVEESAFSASNVLVPNERTALQMRRSAVQRDDVSALLGVRYITLRHAAEEVLHEAGVEFAHGEESLRPLRLRALLQHGLPLRRFKPDLVRSAPGWDRAFARTIGDLEAAGLRPDDLPASKDDARWSDVATVWRAVDEEAGPSWTLARILFEAAGVLQRHGAGMWPFPGPTRTVVTGDEDSIVAHFIRQIPSIALDILFSRPWDAEHQARLVSLYGDLVEHLLPAGLLVPITDLGGKKPDIAVLNRFLFTEPAELIDPDRRRCGEGDATVLLEQHAGVEAEIEGAAQWAAGLIAGWCTRLQDIAILVPRLDPVAGILVDRLRRLPWLDGTIPVHVAGGLPAARHPAAARILAVVRGLAAFLPAEALADLLPSLRASGGAVQHLSIGQAMDLVWSLGTIGGSAANRQGALGWPERMDVIEKRLAAAGGDRAHDGDEDDGAVHDREVAAARRRLEALQAVRPAVEALVAVARQVVERRPLGTLWPALHVIVEKWVLLPGDGKRLLPLLDEELQPACRAEALAALSGIDALDAVEAALLGLRLPEGRFGDPAIYGTITGAAGLAFPRVRIMGLAEGAFPAAEGEDPILPDSTRRLLPPERRPPGAAERVRRQLHQFHAVVSAAEGQVVLSHARTDLNRTEHEPSTIFIDAAAAMRRVDPGPPPEGERVIPDRGALERTGFAPARTHLDRMRHEIPVSVAAQQDVVARSMLGAAQAAGSAGMVDRRRH
jgi:hypothetical protein